MKMRAMGLACLLSVWVTLLQAASIVKENNNEALETGASWVGAVAPSATDVAVWNNNLAGANTSPLNGPATWDGIQVLNPGGLVTISGGGLLTLDGGASTDINLSSATQGLTIEAPVSMGGVMLTDVVAGRTLTFKDSLAITSSGNWGRTGWGTILFDGPVTSAVATTLELQRGTNVFTGVNGGVTLTSTAIGTRFYVGRYSGSDSTLIVSNGFHEARGTDPEANANFVGVSAKGRLIMENGALKVVYLRAGINGGTGDITVNGGTLEASGGSDTPVLSGYALMIANNHQDSATASTASGSLTVNGGAAIFTNGMVKLGNVNAASTGSATVQLNGGMLATRRIYIDGCPLVTKSVTLNGGLLRFAADGEGFIGAGSTNGTTTIGVGDGDARIDTDGHAVTLSAPIQAVGAGGLVKQGLGTLTLSAANTYAGRTRVLGGTLAYAGAALATHPDLTLTSGCGLSLVNGALADFAPTNLVLGAGAAVTLALETAVDSTSCDRLVLPAGTSLGHIDLAPVVQGTATRTSRLGDYAVMTYTGTAPDVSGLRVPDPAAGRSYSFLVDTDAKTVVMRIAFGGSESIWTSPVSGAWETSGNWTVPPANAAGTKVRLDQDNAAPVTVTASSPVTLGGMALSGLQPYVMAGSGFVFDNGVADPYINVSYGAHSVTAPLTLAGDLSVAPESGASLTLSGSLSGSGALVKEGSGDVALTQANSYSGNTRLRGGSVVVTDAATLGTGVVVAEGGTGIRVTGGTPVTLTNDLRISSSSSFTFNTVDTDLTMTGILDWQASLALGKNGPHELQLSGSAYETSGARFLVDQGTVRFLNGSDFYLECGDRDAFQLKTNNGGSRSVVVDPGAHLDVNGFYMEYGVSNSVVVNGGVLNMRGGGGYNDVCLLRANGSGTDSFIVNGGQVTGAAAAWFGVGIRGGNGSLGELVVNGGTTTLGRVSMGVRLESGVFAGNGRVEVTGGLLDVTGSFNWMGDSQVGRTNWVVLGNGTPGSGTLRLPATLNSSFGANNSPLMLLNGGLLETTGLSTFGGTSLDDYLYGAKEIYVGAGGARIHTKGLSVTVTQPLQPSGPGDGGLTKLGSGSLKLTDSASFTGPTVVDQGSLTLPAAYASGAWTVASGAAVSLVNGSIQTQALTAATLQNGAALAFEALADGSACDRIDLPSGASVGDLAVTVLQAGTSQPVSRPGDYAIFGFSGGAPTVSGWTLTNPAGGRTSSFEIVGSTVVLRVAYDTGVAIWTNSGSGAWDTAGNWTEAPADAVGAAARLDDAISAPATVTRDTATTLGSLVFNNASSYTVAGAALTLANVSDEPAVVESEFGVHAIDAPVVLTSNALVRAAVGSVVALNGGVSGAEPLTVEGPGALAIPDTAGFGVSELTLSGAGRVVVSNTATLAIPVTLGTGGGGFSPATDQTLSISATVGGTGGLIKGGSSFLTLTNANAAFAGPATVEAGTLRLDTLPAGGFVFGQGTAHYVGPGETVTGGYTLDTGNATRAGVLRADGDITFQGPVNALSGALVKTGPGTVTFTAAGDNVFSADDGAGASHSVLDIGVNGDSPTTGFSGFNVVDGKVVIGAQGQTNVFHGLVVVGLNSTAESDAETAGTLEVTGGSTTMESELIIGRSNGNTTTAPTARASKLRMTGGDLTVGALVLGRALIADGHNAAPEFELSGGLLTVNGACLWPEQTGAVATVTISGGKLDHLGQDNASVRCCNYGGVLTLNLSGSGELSSTKKLLLSYGAGSQTTLNLDGGTLSVQNIEKGGNGLSGVVRFNGGVYRPTLAGTFQSVTAATVKEGGACFDLSLVDTYTLAQTLTHDASVGGADGGLVKSGSGTLILATKQAYDGPTAVDAGTLRIPVSGGVSNVTEMSVSAGAGLALDGAAIQTVALASLALGEASPAAPAELSLAFASDGASNDVLAVGGALSLGTVDVTVLEQGLSRPFTRSGTYTIMTYASGAPDPADMHVVNPVYGKVYTFAAAAGSVTLTIASDVSGAPDGATVWNVDSGGAWETAGNWTVAPVNAAGSRARFDDKITAPATVSVSAPITAGELYFNNANAYTLAGTAALTLDNGSGTQAVVSVEAGVHALALPMVVGGDGLAVDAASGAGLTLGGVVSGSGALVKTGLGDLTIAETCTRTGLTDIQRGALVLQDGGTPGSGDVLLDGAAGIRVTGSAAADLQSKLTVMNSIQLNTLDNDLVLSGDVDFQPTATTFLKYGTNDLVFAGSGKTVGSSVLNVRSGGLTLASGSAYDLAASAQDAIRLGAGTSAKTALTIEDGAALTAGGISANCDSSGVTGGDTMITQYGGSVTLSNTNALFLRQNGTAPATYVMHGGTLVMPASSWANAGYYGLGRFEMDGGQMTLGRFAPGYQDRTGSYGKGTVEVALSGGRFEALGSWSWMSDGNARVTDVSVDGGVLALPATRTYGTNSANWTSLTLSGGVLEALGAALDTAATDDYLAGLRRLGAGPGSACVFTPGFDVTVRQGLESLSTTGGVVKIGGGALTLAGTNVVRGLVDVQEGTLKARFSHNDLPGMPLCWYRLDSAGLLDDATGHGMPLSLSGTGATTTDRFGDLNAYVFNNDGNFVIGHNAVYPDTTSFTASAWIYVTFNATDSNQSILSARFDSSRTFELKLNSGSNALRLLENSTSASTWWQEILTTNAVPLNQWVHVAAAVSPAGAQLYINGAPQGMRTSNPNADYNGVGWPYPGDIRLVIPTSTSGLLIGRTTSTASVRFKGRIDDVMIYDRVLTDAEVAQLYTGNPLRRVALRVADMGVYDILGGTQTVSEVTGSGQVINGTLSVQERLAPGDSESAAAGEVLTAANLTLGTNVTYACSFDDVVSDLTDVTGLLTVAGAGVLDLGRTEANPIVGSFSTVIMTYGSISGAENFANWTVTGIGRNGFTATVTAADGEVVVNLKSTWGTLLYLK